MEEQYMMSEVANLEDEGWETCKVWLTMEAFSDK